MILIRARCWSVTNSEEAVKMKNLKRMQKDKKPTAR